MEFDFPVAVLISDPSTKPPEGRTQLPTPPSRNDEFRERMIEKHNHISLPMFKRERCVEYWKEIAKDFCTESEVEAKFHEKLQHEYWRLEEERSQKHSSILGSLVLSSLSPPEQSKIIDLFSEDSIDVVHAFVIYLLSVLVEGYRAEPGELRKVTDDVHIEEAAGEESVGKASNPASPDGLLWTSRAPPLRRSHRLQARGRAATAPIQNAGVKKRTKRRK
ncbi:MAG: hypothetical protein M1836_003716 [Candelina mexicana]|nr:MAG: hypothetical protein M1836_003716 [Candelina mexicana]